jgi:hypothetical protein
MPLTAPKSQFLEWLRGSPDDDVLRWIYRGLLGAAFAVLILDYGDVQDLVGRRDTASSVTDSPISAPLVERLTKGPHRAPKRMLDGKLREKMRFELLGDGRLMAIGTILPGTANAFADEVERRGSYIKTVVLESPGGSVRDALAMGHLIRDKKFSTEVENNRYCASSCPLVFAAGIERRAGVKAAIGVHQVSALSSGETLSGAAGMEGGQQISAACQKYLRAMGVDPDVWVHAMETSSDDLYYFRAAELQELRLATQIVDSKLQPEGVKRARK